MIQDTTFRGSKLVTGATVGLLTANEARAHLNLPSGIGDNEYLLSLVVAATAAVENYTGLRLLTQTFQDVHDMFPKGGKCLFLRNAPAASVTSVTYLDTAGDSQTWSASEYTTDLVSVPGRIAPKPNYTYPLTSTQIKAVTVNYTAGYGSTAASVPADLVQAVKMVLVDFYENRGEAPREMRTSVHALLSPYVNYSML